MGYLVLGWTGSAARFCELFCSDGGCGRFVKVAHSWGCVSQATEAFINVSNSAQETFVAQLYFYYAAMNAGKSRLVAVCLQLP